MSDEEKQWLTDALKQYTYDDSDKLRELCEEMKKEVEIDFDVSKGAKEGEDLYNMIDDLQRVIELHERIGLNLALLGGLKSLMSYMFSHPDDKARQIACHTFS
jgi:hypothetical protein